MANTLPIVILWCMCLGKRILRGRADRLPSAPKRILVAQMAKLGDMVCTTPVFRAIKKAYPTAHVSVMGNAINREVLEGNTDVDEYLVFGDVRSAYVQIRDGHFDAAITVVPDVVVAALSYLADVPFIVVPQVTNGYSPFESFWYRSLRRFAGLSVHELRMRHYTPREYVRLLEPLGIKESDTTKHLAFSLEAGEKAEALFGSARGMRVGVSPSAGNKNKNWGAERFARLAHMLSKRFDIELVIFGGERDREETDALKRLLDPSVRFLDLTEKLSVDELKAAVPLLDLFVAVDTGPIYIAEAFRVATVDILGPVAEGEQAPVGERHLVVPPPSPRVPQMYNMNVHTFDPAEVRRQIEATTVESVYSACEHLLQKIQAHAQNS